MAITDRIREQISALIDGELPEDEMGLLLRRLERDAQLRLAFGRYVMAGEVMRSPGGDLASTGFAARVSAALDEAGPAPALGAPESLPRERWNRPWFAAAVAASAAIMAVLLGVYFSPMFSLLFKLRATPPKLILRIFTSVAKNILHWTSMPSIKNLVYLLLSFIQSNSITL